MYLGQRVLIKYNGIVVEGSVEQIFEEDLLIRVSTTETVMRKYWETRQIKGTSYEKKD